MKTARLEKATFLDSPLPRPDDNGNECQHRTVMAIYTISWDEALDKECRGGAVTIGNFDGVHRGHQALLAETRRQADALDGPAISLTFDPHPLRLLRPQQFQ